MNNIPNIRTILIVDDSHVVLYYNDLVPNSHNYILFNIDTLYTTYWKDSLEDCLDSAYLLFPTLIYPEYPSYSSMAEVTNYIRQTYPKPTPNIITQ